MKKKHRLVTWLSLLALLLGIVLPIVTSANSAKAVGEENSDDGGFEFTEGVIGGSIGAGETEVYIHRLQATKYDQDALADANENHSGQEIDTTALGPDVKGVEGVQFHIYKFDDFENVLKNELGFTISVEDALPMLIAEAKEAAIEKLEDAAEVAPTDPKGVTHVTLPDGKYVIVEDPTNNPSETEAVSSILTLPARDADGKRSTELHIYPKSTIPEQIIPVKTVGSEYALQDSFDANEVFTWYLQSTIPDDFANYHYFAFEDAVPLELTTHDDHDTTLKLRVGEKPLAAEDYNFYHSYKTGVDGDLLVIELTPIGIIHVADLAKGTDDKLIAEVHTSINGKEEDNAAILGKPIENDLTVSFLDGRGSYGKKHPSNTPWVATGGKRFKKVNADKKGLGGAQFIIRRGAPDGEIVSPFPPLDYGEERSLAFVDQSNFGQSADSSADTASFGAQAGLYPSALAAENDDRLVLTSANDGSFEVTGLAYGDYYLEEIKAPDGYVKLEEPTYFEVNATSYNTDPANIEYNEGDASQQVIPNNKRPPLPNTGGIGSFALIAAGIALVGSSLYHFTKQHKDA